MPLPLVAIVGRPNVGKSTLFNRLANRRDAIVTDIPGTTRDRLLAEVAWDDSRFILVDTGGLEPYPQDVLRDQVKAQVEAAVDQADLIVFRGGCGGRLGADGPGDRRLAPSEEEALGPGGQQGR